MTEPIDDFVLTSGELARLAGVLPNTIRLYATMGLLPFKPLSNGQLTFRRVDVTEVQAILARRKAGRIRRRGAVGKSK